MLWLPLGQMLYALDREAYIHLLNIIEDVDDEVTDEQETVTDTTPETPAPEVEVDSKSSDRDSWLELGNPYVGVDAEKLADLTSFIAARSPINEPDAAQFAADLLSNFEENLGVDWNKSARAQAVVRLMIKRILTHYTMPKDQKGLLQTSIFDWFLTNLPMDGSE